MRTGPSSEPFDRVLPAALLHIWGAGGASARRAGLAAKALGAYPAGLGRWLFLPTAGDAALFDRAAAFALDLAASEAPESSAVRLLVTPAAANVGREIELLPEPLSEELVAEPPNLAPGKVLLTTHAAHQLEGSWTVEASGNLTTSGGRLIPLAALRPRTSALPGWRNPEVLSRAAKWVPRPDLEEALLDQLNGPITRLVGGFGVGKTRLAWEVLRAAGDPVVWRDAGQYPWTAGRRKGLVEALATEPARPVWVLYDHLESATPQVWAEIEELSKHPQFGQEIRLLLLARPAVAWPADLDALPTLEVGPLPGEGWGRFTTQLFRGLSLPDAVASSLAAGAAGNPFALEEALHFLVRDRRLRQVFGSFFFSGNEEGPTRFQPSRRFLAHAEAEALRLGSALPLRLLAQVESPVPAGELGSAALAASGGALPRRWETPLLEAGLLVEGEGPWGEGLAFASPALRAAFSDTLRPEAAQTLRGMLGELLVARSSATEEVWAAYALLRGSDSGARALVALSQAPAKVPREALFTALRFELAALGERESEHGLEAELLWILLPLARRMGRLHEIAPALERGFDLSREQPQRYFAIAALRAELAQMAGRFGEAEAVLRQALANPAGGEARRKEMLLLELGRVLLRQGKDAEAGELFAKTLGVAERQGRRGLAATCRYFLGNVALHAFRLDEARALHLAALESRRERGPGVATSLTALGAVSLASGDLPSGLGYYQEACALFEQEKAEAEETYALVGLGRTLSRLGDFAAAAPIFRRALALREGRDDTMGEALVRLAVAENLLQLDQPDQALAEARRAHFELSLVPSGEARADAEQLLGRIQTRLRRHDAARTNLDEAERLHRELGRGASLLADLSYRIDLEIAREQEAGVAAGLAALATELERLREPPQRALADYHLYLAAEWLRTRGDRRYDPRPPLERCFAELVRQTNFLAPEARQRFLMQVPLHRGVMEAASRLGLALPAR